MEIEDVYRLRLRRVGSEGVRLVSVWSEICVGLVFFIGLEKNCGLIKNLLERVSRYDDWE